MKLSVPREDPDEMLFYIWKIIDLPNIDREDFLYKLIFEFFIFTPDEASSFLDAAINTGSLIEGKGTLVRLSDELSIKFIEWQKQRKLEIKSNMVARKKRNKIVQRIQGNDENAFNQLFKKLVDSDALNRAVSISDDALEILKVSKKDGIIDAKIKGTKEESYSMSLNIAKKTLMHDCHDYRTRRAKNKTFCKHLIKLFLTLKRKNEGTAIYFLENIISNINDWQFSS